MTIGKVMDWIEARLEAVKSREEEEDEDEERERVRGGTSNAASAPTASKSTATTKARSTENIAPISRPKDQVFFSRFSIHHYSHLSTLIFDTARCIAAHTAFPSRSFTRPSLISTAVPVTAINSAPHNDDTPNTPPALESTFQIARYIPHIQPALCRRFQIRSRTRGRLRQ